MILYEDLLTEATASVRGTPPGNDTLRGPAYRSDSFCKGDAAWE